MAKLIALYKKPEDAAEFDKHYAEVHMPLASKMPGLRKACVNKIVGGASGESEYYQIAELYFDNMDALKAALASPEGRAAGKDVMGFAGKIVTMIFAEELDLASAEGKAHAHAGSSCC